MYIKDYFRIRNQRGDACICYKKSLPIKIRNINYIQGCISFNLKIGSKLCSIVSLYRSTSQSADEFEDFLNKLNLTMESIIQKNPFLVVATITTIWDRWTSFKNLTDFLKPRKQRVVLNDQHSCWSDSLARVPRRAILGSLLFLIYTIHCNPKLFANDNSLFATVHNISKATNDLNNDLSKITKWAFQWKMNFNPDISKQAHETIFSSKRSIVSYPI